METLAGHTWVQIGNHIDPGHGAMEGVGTFRHGHTTNPVNEFVLSVTSSGWLDEGRVEGRVDEAKRGCPKPSSRRVVVSFVQMQFQNELCLGKMESPGPGNEEP